MRLLPPGGDLRPPVPDNAIYGEAQLALGLRGAQEALGGLGEAGGEDGVRRPDREAGRLRVGTGEQRHAHNSHPCFITSQRFCVSIVSGVISLILGWDLIRDGQLINICTAATTQDLRLSW